MALKLDFTQPPPPVQTLAEAQALIGVLWEIARRVESLQGRVAELEEQVSLSSRNSSQPPSQDGPGAPRHYIPLCLEPLDFLSIWPNPILPLNLPRLRPHLHKFNPNQIPRNHNPRRQYCPVHNQLFLRIQLVPVRYEFSGSCSWRGSTKFSHSSVHFVVEPSRSSLL
jgi:hypothetical protein